MGGNDFRSRVASLELPSRLVYAGTNAFANHRFLTNLEFAEWEESGDAPDLVIGAGAFRTTDQTAVGQRGYATITLPVNATILGDGAFNVAALHTAYILPNSRLSVLGNLALGGAAISATPDGTGFAPGDRDGFFVVDGALYLREVTETETGPRRITTLRVYPGSNTDPKFEVPYGVTHIGPGVFQGHTHLQEVIIPATVTHIGNSAFQNTSALINVEIPNTVTHIGNSAFQNSAIENITLPNSITHIGSSAFQNSAITSITIPNSVVEIGNSAFASTAALTTATFEEGGTSDLHFGLTTAAANAAANMFQNSGVISVHLPTRLVALRNSTFIGCTRLTTVTFENNQTRAAVWQGSLFANTPNLINITLPEGLEQMVGTNIFQNSGLENIQLPSTLTHITGSNTFQNTRLTSFAFPPALTHPSAMQLFNGVTTMPYIIVPATVQQIGIQSFQGWTATQRIYLHGRTAVPGSWGTLTQPWYGGSNARWFFLA